MNKLCNAFSKAWQSVPKVGAGGAPQVLVGAGTGVSVLIAFGLGTYGAYHSVVTVQPGHRGIVYNRFGGLDDKHHLKEGLNFVIPWVQRPIVYDKNTYLQSSKGRIKAKFAEFNSKSISGALSDSIAAISYDLLQCLLDTATQCDGNKQNGAGLLTGFDTTCLCRAPPFYATDLNISDAKEFVLDAYRIYNASKLDSSVDYDSYVTRAVEFAFEKDFYDRAELGILQKVVLGHPGAFVCVLGGKSTGKSKFVSVLSAKYPASTIAMDCRSTPNIVSGIIAALAAKEVGTMERPKEVLKEVIKDVASGAANSSTTLPPSLSHVLDVILKNTEGTITILIDEANLLLPTNKSPETIAATRTALNLFTRLTKQERKMNVVLVSSEHTLPLKLNDSQFGFNVLDLDGRVIYAGEVPPAAMYRLLTEKWLVPHHLSVALISTYGGHIHDVINALITLANGAKECRSVPLRLDAQLGSAVKSCLKWKGSGPEDEERMRKILTDLAVRGFSQLDDDTDPVAEKLTSSGVAGMVTFQSPLIVGLDRALWDPKGSDHALIPSKQSMRLVIARFL